MSGETIVVWGQMKALESAGAQVANNSLVKATTGYDQAADGLGYPDAQFVLNVTFSAAPTENTTLSLYARELLPDGVNNTDEPETTRAGRPIGSFIVNNVTSKQTLTLNAYDLPPKADYYLHNNGTGQAVAAGWDLKIKPRSYKAA